jgi:hypothetical protein
MVGIDTVTLTLKNSDFAMFEPSRFTPNATRIIKAGSEDMGKSRFMRAVCNPTKQDTATFGYLPYLTLYKALRAGGFVTELRIQFSAPKLMYGNNFDELCAKDFDRTCERLLDALNYYGVKVYGGTQTIAAAQVAVMHYAKNFALTNYMTARQAITELQKCNVNAWQDVSKTDYLDNGAGYKTHSKSRELAFYDKLAEHRKNQRGQATFDADQQLQFDLFGNHDIKQPFEVLRMEIRLGSGRAIKSALGSAGLPTDEITFATLFSPSYSQRILTHQLSVLYNNYPKITEASAPSITELFSSLYIQNPRRNLSTIVNAIGLYTLSQHIGLRGAKDIVGSRGSAALTRLVKRTNHELQYATEKSEVFEVLQNGLHEFTPLHLKDFENC